MANDNPVPPDVDSSFSRTQQLELPGAGSPGTTGEVMRAAAARVSSSVGRRVRGAAATASEAIGHRARRAGAWLAAHPRCAAVGAFGLVALGLVVVLAMRSGGAEVARSSEQKERDRVTALVDSRHADADGTDPSKAMAHARAAIELREFTEALEVLERLQRADPGVAEDAEFISLAIQTFQAGRTQRTLALLKSADRDVAVPMLQAATGDWPYRVRHGAKDALEAFEVPVADPVALSLLDVWQLERCDQRRAVAAKLLSSRASDERILPGLEAAARRPSDDGCLEDLLPAKSAKR